MGCLRNPIMQILTAICVCMMFTSCTVGKPREKPTSPEIVERQLAGAMQLADAAEWTIRNAVCVYFKHGEAFLKDKYRNTWQTILTPLPQISLTSDKPFDLFLNSGSLRMHILGIKLPNRKYEFWVVKLLGKPWTHVNSRVDFYVVSVDESSSARAIVHKSPQFLPFYDIDSNTRIVFPTNNLSLQNRLRAWEFPEFYLNTDMDDYEVLVNSNSVYKKRRVRR